MSLSEVVVVVGARGLVGQHLLQNLHKAEGVRLIRTVDVDEAFEASLPYEESVAMERQWGTLEELLAGGLERALEGADVLINCLDCQDLRLVPDAKRTKALNQDVVEELARVVGRLETARVIQMSSLLVGASFMAPSVFPSELSTALPSPAFSVFPTYVAAKQAAEVALAALPKTAKTQIFTLRLPMLYGEGDTSSFITDVLRYAERHGGVCPLLHRPHGKVQYAYAGNVGHGIVCALGRMRAEGPGKRELVNLVDDTPTGHTWDLVKPFAEARGLAAPPRDLPFYAAYVPWRLAEVGAGLAAALGLPVPARLRAFPSSGLLYAHFFYWYFWSGVKARLYLDFVPPYDHQLSLKRSLPHYKALDLSKDNSPI